MLYIITAHVDPDDWNGKDIIVDRLDFDTEMSAIAHAEFVMSYDTVYDVEVYNFDIERSVYSRSKLQGKYYQLFFKVLDDLNEICDSGSEIIRADNFGTAYKCLMAWHLYHTIVFYGYRQLRKEVIK